jgi:hypothetical protein
MGFMLSPGVTVSEIDLTTVIPAVATTGGAFAGNFQWGPIEKRVLIDSEIRLVENFGKPNANTFQYFFTAANFLAYGNNLRVVRGANNATRNATANSAAALLIKNEDEYESNYLDGSGTFGLWAARYGGGLGNTLKVSICPSANGYSSNLTAQISSTANAATVGDTTITVTADPTSYLSVNDLVKLGTNDYIKVSQVNSGNIVLSGAITANIGSGTAILRKWQYADEFDGAPGTTAYTSNVGGADDECHIVVVDEDGGISGTPETVIEKYPFVSKGSDVKDESGTSLYYPEVIFKKSKWIYWGDHDTNGTNWGTSAAGKTYTAVYKPSYSSLGGGVDAPIVNADLIVAYDLFANADVVDISLVVSGPANQTIATHLISNIAETRKDCVVFLSPLAADVIDNSGNESDDVVTYRNLLASTSYAFLDSAWKYQYDKYNDTYRWIPVNGDTAGLCVRTDNTRDPWFSPAGFNRGQIKNTIKLSWTPSQTERDELYKNGINPVTTFPGEGTILYGDKTLQSKPSAFDRINVRRLFIVLEKAIARAAKYSLFEFNDEFTRAQFVALVDPFLRDVQGRRGIYDFRVVCDTSNNTPEVIDRNEFRGDIYIKPARSINFIQLNFVAVRTGVSFEEVTGKF